MQNLRKTIGTLLLAGSTILSSCGTNYIPENDTYLQRKKEQDAEVAEIMKEAMNTIDQTFEKVEDYMKNAEKELEEMQRAFEIRGE